MKPNEPHSFTPRNPDDAEGRVTCAVCALAPSAEPHLLGMLQRMVQHVANPLVLCSVCGLRKCYRKGKCRACYRRETIVSAVVTPELTERMDTARGATSRSEFIRAVLGEWMDRHFPEDPPRLSAEQSPTKGGHLPGADG